MRHQIAGMLITATLGYVTVAPPWQDPQGGPRPGPPGRGERDPGRPPRPEDDQDRPPPPPFGPPPNPLFLAIDADDDGELSPKEIADASKGILKLDKNKDGIITEDEARPPRPPGGRRGPGGPPPAADEDHGRPVEAIARELGVTPEKFREAFRKVRPARPGQRPTEARRQENRKVLSEGLGVSPERLDEVMDKYRPGGPTNDAPPR